jgi:hypothetical protein
MGKQDRTARRTDVFLGSDAGDAAEPKPPAAATTSCRSGRPSALDSGSTGRRLQRGYLPAAD